MTKRKTYYKIVTSDLKSLGVINVSGLPERFWLQYSTKEWTKPIPGTDLFVFTSLNAAKYFYKDYNLASSNKTHKYNRTRSRCFSVRVKSPRIKGLFTFDLGCLCREIRKRLYKKKYINNLQYLINTHNVPTGTVFCSAVKLEKEIDCKGW